MIILKDIRFFNGQISVEVELPRANMVVDPRPNHPRNYTRFLCDYHDNGTTVTITRLNHTYYETFSFRVYDPATETVPSFDSTIYTFFGEDGEMAPYDTTVLIIHPSVTVIKENAFFEFDEIKKCYMHDGVHTIESFAFFGCLAMKTIRLSRTLTHIKAYAFNECESLEAVFLPPTVNQIRKGAFRRCRNLRIFPLPINIDISQIGKGLLDECDNFFQTTQIQHYVNLWEVVGSNHRVVHQEIIQFYRDRVPPLHKVCLDTHVTRQTIQECINTHGPATASITDHDGMTPLHILAMNPHADIGALLACFDLNMSSAFVGDSRGNTPLDYLRVHHDGIEDHTSLVSSLCMHRYACRSSHDDPETATNMNKKRKRSNDE